jgi:hypothetical protein
MAELVGQDGILRPIGNRPSSNFRFIASKPKQSAAGFHPAPLWLMPFPHDSEMPGDLRRSETPSGGSAGQVPQADKWPRARVYYRPLDRYLKLVAPRTG